MIKSLSLNAKVWKSNHVTAEGRNGKCQNKIKGNPWTKTTTSCYTTFTPPKQFLCCTAKIQYRKPQKLDTECQLRHELKIGAVSISDVVSRIC